MVPAWNGRIRGARERAESGEGRDHLNQQIIVSDSWMIPKGAPNKDLAMKAIAIMSRPEVNARIANFTSTTGPSNIKAYETGVIPKESSQACRTAPENARKGFVQEQFVVGQ